MRDLVSRCNSYGLLAFYQTEECRYQKLLSEMRSSRPFQRNHVSRLISLPVDDKYITLPNVMDLIEECFSNAIKRSRQGRFAIYGMGGAGKTSLAACYAKKRVDLKRDVFWICARTEDTLNTDFGDAATDMNLGQPESDAMSSVRRRDAVKNYLSRSAGRKPPIFVQVSIYANFHMVAQDWLLVFDDVEDFDLLEHYMPRCDRGSILITSRNPASKYFCGDRGVELHRMTDDDAIQLLRSHLPDHLYDKEEDLLRTFSCQTLGALPLAIKLAALYMLEHQCSLKEYINLMHQGRDTVEKMHRFQPSGDSSFYKYTVATCWNISKEKMKDQNKTHALVLLDLIMFLDNQGLPEKTFGLLGDIPNTLSALKSLIQPYNLYEAFGTLRKHSLLQKDPELNTFSVHPMIHAAIYENMSPLERQSAHENATYILWKMFPGPKQSNDDMVSRWRVSNIYFPHLLRNWARGQDSKIRCSQFGAEMLRNGAQ